MIVFRPLLTFILLIASVLVVSAYAARPSPTPPPPNPNYNPVVLVHGLCVKALKVCESGLKELKDYLVNQGYQTYIAPIPSNDNVENAEFLANYIQQILSSTGKSQVHLIGHSMGPLSMLYYVKYLGGVDKVSTFVALDSDASGFALLCGAPDSRGGQLCPTNPFWINLFAGEDTVGSPTYAQIIAEDSIAGWTQEQIQKSIYDGGVWWSSFPTDHDGIIKETGVFEMIASTLLGTPSGQFIDKPIQ